MSDLYNKESPSHMSGGSSVGTTPPLTDLSGTPSVADPDIALDKEVKKLQSVLDFHSSEVEKLEQKLNPVISVTPDPTVETVKFAKEALEKSKLINKAAEEIYLKIIAETSIYENVEKQVAQRNTGDMVWKSIVDKLENIQLTATQYISKLPVPTLFRWSDFLCQNSLVSQLTI